MTISQNPEYPILVVDDDVVSLGLLKTQLNKAGINNVITCNDSTKVMDLFAQNSIEIALIDLQMPNISGQELLTIFADNSFSTVTYDALGRKTSETDPNGNITT